MGVQILITIGVALSGLLAGILVNYLSDILPSQPVSVYPKCPNCGSRLIIGNYFLRPNTCNTCRERLSGRIGIIDLTFIAISLYIYAFPPQGIETLLGFVTAIYFGTLMVIDIEHRIIPYSLIFAGIVLGLIVGTSRVGITFTIFGGFIGFIIMLAIYSLGIVFVKVSNRFRSAQIDEPALGFGDVLLGGVLGLMIGWPEILNSMVISIIIAGAFSLILLLVMIFARRYKFGMAFAYAPFLLLAAFYTLFIAT